MFYNIIILSLLAINSSSSLFTKPEDSPNDEKKFALNLEEADLNSFIRFIMDLKEHSYIPNPETENVKVSLTVPEKISEEETYRKFLTILESNGYMLVSTGGLYKIVKKDGKFKDPINVIIGKPSSDLPETDETLRFLTFLKNIPVSDVEKILKELLSPNAQVIPLPAYNGLLITDRSMSIKYAMRIINELDDGGIQEVVSLIKLKNIQASEAKEFLDKFLSGGKNDSNPLARILAGGNDNNLEFFPSGLKVIIEERTNTLILTGALVAIERVEKFVKNVLDRPDEKINTPFYVYECQYMSADTLKNIISEVTRKADSGSGSASFGGVKAGTKYFNSVKIEADREGNRLIIYCADIHDWKIIEKTLKDLDKKPPQVLVDTLIVEITNNDTKGLSGQIRNKSEGSPLPGVNFQTSGVIGAPQLTTQGSEFVSLLTNLVKGLTKLEQGSTFLSFGAPDNVWALLKVLSTQVKVSVISRPSVTIANKATGTITLGGTKRIPSETFISDNSTNGSFSGYQTANATNSISYQPQINQEGLISLKVDINMTDFLDSGSNTTSKNMNTNLMLANGQVMAMGGFVKTKAVDSVSKAPFSGIPILGLFGRSKGRDIEKRYIFFFVTATVIQPRQDPGINIITKMKLHEAKDLIADSIQTAWGKDWIDNKFFNGDKDDYAHKVTDFANARYQPTTVDIRRDPFYKSTSLYNLDKKNEQQEYEPSQVETIYNTKTPDKTIERFESSSTNTIIRKEKQLKDSIQFRSKSPASLLKQEASVFEKEKKLKDLLFNSAKTTQSIPSMAESNGKESFLQKLNAKSGIDQSNPKGKDNMLAMLKSEPAPEKNKAKNARQSFLEHFSKQEVNPSSTQSGKEAFLASLKKNDAETKNISTAGANFENFLTKKETTVLGEKNSAKEGLLKSLLGKTKNAEIS